MDTALADGVEELVAKEKALFELEMLEKERELAEMRQKYEELAAVAGAQKNAGGAYIGDARDPEELSTTAADHWKMVRLAGAAHRTSAGLRPPRTAYARKLLTLHVLDLRCQGIGHSELQHLCKQIMWLGTLKTVILSQNRIDEACAPLIVELLALNMRHVDLSRNALGPACLRALVQALQRNETLEVLDVTENPFGRVQHAGLSLGQAVRENPVSALRDLRVSMHDFVYGVARRQHALHNAASLTTLLLKPMPAAERRGGRGGGGRSMVGSTAAAAAAAASSRGQKREERGRTLQSLSLVHAHLERRTVEAIAHHSQSLTHLDLTSSFLGPSGALTLASWLSRSRASHSLVSLQLSHSSLTPVGGAALAKMLRRNRHLTHVNLANNELNDAVATLLGAALRENPVLTALPLDRNDIRTEGGLQLMRGLRRNASLTDLGDLSSLRLPVNLASALDGRVLANREQRSGQETSNLILFEHEDDVIRVESAVGDGSVLMIDGIVDHDGFIRVDFEARVIHAGSANRSDCFAWKITRDSDPSSPPVKQGTYRDGLVRGLEPNVTQFRSYSVVLPRWEGGGEFCLWMRACDALGNGVGSGAGTRLVVQCVQVTQELDVTHNLLYEHQTTIEHVLTQRNAFPVVHAMYVAHAGSVRLMFEARVSIVSPAAVIPGFNWRVGLGGPEHVASGSHEDGLADSRRADALHYRKYSIVLPNCAVGDRVELCFSALPQAPDENGGDPNVIYSQQQWIMYVRSVALFLEESEGGKVADVVQLQFAAADPFSLAI